MDKYIIHLKEKINNKTVLISATKAPVFISCFLRDVEDIILISKEVGEAVLGVSCRHSQSDTFNNLDFTGQPLEAPSEVYLNSSLYVDVWEDHHFPISIEDARQYISISNVTVKPPVAVWALIDGLDSDKTVLLSGEKHGPWITRSWAIHSGYEVPTIEYMRDKHTDISRLPSQKASCSVTCKYEINCIKNDFHSPAVYSSVLLHVSWKKMCFEPPLLHKSTETSLEAKVRIGCGEGVILLIWNQISLIRNYLDIIKQSGDNVGVLDVSLPSSKSVLELFDMNVTGDESPIKRIRKMLKEPPLANLDSPSPSLSEALTQTTAPGSDLTDRLWPLFIECSSYKELSICLQQLLIEIKKIQYPAAFSSSSNISRLARMSMGEAGVIYDPLEYLVEIGLEKLRKDVMFIFSRARIGTANQLNIPDLPSFSSVSSVDWIKTVELWLQWLCRVQCVLEVFWNIQEVLADLPASVLNSIAIELLKTYTGKDSKIEGFDYLIQNPLQEIKANIPKQSVENYILMPPEEWRLTLTSSTEQRKMRSVYLKRVENPFPSSVVGDITGSTLLHGHSHWFELHSVSDKFF